MKHIKTFDQLHESLHLDPEKFEKVRKMVDDFVIQNGKIDQERYKYMLDVYTDAIIELNDSGGDPRSGVSYHFGDASKEDQIFKFFDWDTYPKRNDQLSAVWKDKDLATIIAACVLDIDQGGDVVKELADNIKNYGDIFGQMKSIVDFHDESDGYSISGNNDKFTVSYMFDVELDDEATDAGIERDILASVDAEVTKAGPDKYDVEIKVDADHKEAEGWKYSDDEDYETHSMSMTAMELRFEIEELLTDIADEHYGQIQSSLSKYLGNKEY